MVNKVNFNFENEFVLDNNSVNQKINKIDDINDDEIMTMNQVSMYLKISEKIINRLVKEGEVPVFRIG